MPGRPIQRAHGHARVQRRLPAEGCVRLPKLAAVLRRQPRCAQLAALLWVTGWETCMAVVLRDHEPSYAAIAS